MFIQKAITKHYWLCIFFITPIFLTFLLTTQLSAVLMTDLRRQAMEQPPYHPQALPPQQLQQIPIELPGQEELALQLMPQQQNLQLQLAATRQQLREERLLHEQQQRDILELQEILEERRLLMQHQQLKQESQNAEHELMELIVQLQQLQQEQQLMVQTMLEEEKEENNLD